MRSLLTLCVLGLVSSGFASDLTVHEWGTFTSVVGSDGRPLSGLEVEEEGLPAFVRSFAGFAPRNKGWDRPVAGVTVKMETPVIYFYADQAMPVKVSVSFHGGSISQWYPERSGGEQLRDPKPAELVVLAPVDFSRGYEGSATWQIDVLPRYTSAAITARREWETPQWPRARVASANRIRGSQGEVESSIFYRGIGNFPLPLSVTSAAGGGLELVNHGDHEIPFVWIYRKPEAGGSAESWFGRLAAGERHIERTLRLQEVPFTEALVSAGLTSDEARALVDTWRESYFDRPGLRIFWIVPRTFTDSILPIEITPRPSQLERVLVGRTEVLTPEFEQTLLRAFALHDENRWAGDRYFRAYSKRVQALRERAGLRIISAVTP